MSIFDGMAGLLNEVFGSPVTFVDAGTGALSTVTGLFREDPVEVAGENGGLVLIEQPSLRVPEPLAPDAVRGDRVLLPDGRQFRIESRIKSGSPAGDRFLIFTLERIA